MRIWQINSTGIPDCRSLGKHYQRVALLRCARKTQFIVNTK